MKILLVLLILFLIFLFIKYHLNKKKVLKVQKLPQKIIINNSQELEFSDLQYYNDLESEFNKRLSWYNSPTIVNDTLPLTDIDIYIPEALLNDLDTQNVHDSTIQSSIANLYNNNAYSSNFTNSNTLDNIIKCDPSITDIVNKIKNRNSFISNLNTNEVNVIENVWNSGNDNVKENLILQLKDCKNGNNSIFCPTGVVSRVVSSLAIEDPDTMPKDKATINNEVLHKFSKLFNNGDTNLSKIDIKNEILQDYSQPKMKETVENCIDEWIEHI